jgi:hypothetical protein
MSLQRSYPPQSWLDPRLEVRPSSIQGMGMFAREPIRAGETAIIWGGAVFTEQEIQSGRARPNTFAAIEEGLYLADPVDATGDGEAVDYYLNHSCDPNLWMGDEITLVARRDIPAGEELTVDYALWESDPQRVLAPCCCGSSMCRGEVTGDDWRRPELRRRYEGHFMPYLNRRIAAERELYALVHARSQALVQTDEVALEVLLAPDFTYTNAAGRSFNRAAYLEHYLRSGKLHFLSQALEDVEIRLLGEAAYATLRTHDRFVYLEDDNPASEAAGDFRSLFVYARRSGRWLCVAGQTVSVR